MILKLGGIYKRFIFKSNINVCILIPSISQDLDFHILFPDCNKQKYPTNGSAAVYVINIHIHNHLKNQAKKERLKHVFL